jgi:site-specific recombinase XerD
MSNKIAPEDGKLEDNPLWREACDLAEYVYGLLHEFPEEEKFDTVAKLRHASNDLMFNTAQAVSNKAPAGAEYEWSYVLRNINSLKTMYRFAGRQKCIKLDPEIMVRCDKLAKQANTEIEKAAAKTKANEKKQLDLWREQYRLWRKMHEQDEPELSKGDKL